MGVSTSFYHIFVKEGDQVAQHAVLAMSGLPTFTAPCWHHHLCAFQGDGGFPNIPVLTLVDLKHLYVPVL